MARKCNESEIIEIEIKKMKPARNLLFVTCAVLILCNLYGTINLRMQNGNSDNHEIHLNTLSQNRGYNINIPLENYTINTYTDYSEQRRQLAGIQMSMGQMKVISEALLGKGNLLVWGLGNDSPFLHNCTTGKVVFIEDDIPLRKAGITWYDAITKKYPFLEVYRVHYTAHTARSFNKYVNSSEIWSELDLRGHLPVSVRQTHWHVIIVNAHLGCCQMGPGRYQSIYTSSVLASEGTHIFVDDFERKVEHEFSIKVFGQPAEVIKRQNTKASPANEQAHFILNSAKQTKLEHINDTKPGYFIASRQDIAENRNDNWTILLTVNNGFFDFFENWRWHFQQLNIHVPISVIAEDSIVFDRLINLSEISIKVSRSEYISINKTVNYGSVSYKEMVSARPTYIMMHLKKGTNVIYSDIDSVWLKNPLPYLEGNFDIWSQLDTPNKFCTGFLAIKSNKDTLKLIQNWDNVLRKKPMLNQLVFNRLVKNSTIKIKALDSRKFPSGKQYFGKYSKGERSGAVIIHNNWIIGHDKKIKRFQNTKLWVNHPIV